MKTDSDYQKYFANPTSEVSEAPMVQTEFGWALASLTPPYRTDLFWVKMPERHVYTWDADGWYRIKPPERAPIPDHDLPHG